MIKQSITWSVGILCIFLPIILYFGLAESSKDHNARKLSLSPKYEWKIGQVYSYHIDYNNKNTTSLLNTQSDAKSRVSFSGEVDFLAKSESDSTIHFYLLVSPFSVDIKLPGMKEGHGNQSLSEAFLNSLAYPRKIRLDKNTGIFSLEESRIIDPISDSAIKDILAKISFGLPHGQPLPMSWSRKELDLNGVVNYEYSRELGDEHSWAASKMKRSYEPREISGIKTMLKTSGGSRFEMKPGTFIFLNIEIDDQVIRTVQGKHYSRASTTIQISFLNERFTNPRKLEAIAKVLAIPIEGPNKNMDSDTLIQRSVLGDKSIDDIKKFVEEVSKKGDGSTGDPGPKKALID